MDKPECFGQGKVDVFSPKCGSCHCISECCAKELTRQGFKGYEDYKED